MAGEANNLQGSSMAREIDAALSTLDSVLAEAGRAVAAIRSQISQVTVLETKVREMEAAMSRALESLSLPLGGAQPATSTPTLRSVPPSTPEQAQPELAAAAPTAALPETAAQPSAAAAQCLRLNVHSGAGSLDLKAVDGAVNENPEVVDVALLDYDGRQATLKLWISGSADADSVRESLLSSLKSRLGDEASAELEVDAAEAAA